VSARWNGALAFSSQLALKCFFPRVFDGQQDCVGISGHFVAREDTPELGVGGQLALLKKEIQIVRKSLERFAR